MQVSGTGSVRRNLSVLHLLSAAYFARQAAVVEQAHEGEQFSAFYEEIFANACGSLLASVAALEAHSNELFLYADRYLPSAASGVVDVIWQSLERSSALDKFDAFLRLQDKDKLDRGSEPTQSVVLLGALRNALTHFKSESPDAPDAHARLSRGLSSRIRRSPYFDTADLLVPNAWATSEASRWAVDTCLAFDRAFATQAGIEL